MCNLKPFLILKGSVSSQLGCSATSIRSGKFDNELLRMFKIMRYSSAVMAAFNCLSKENTNLDHLFVKLSCSRRAEMENASVSAKYGFV